MKKFTKLALISSMAISANAMAMQAMDDSALSATTGQDGLSIGIGISKIEIEKLFIHDNGGLSTTATMESFGGIKLKSDQSGIEYTPGKLPTLQRGTVVEIDTNTASYDSASRAVNLGGKGESAAIVIYGNGIAGNANETHGLVIGANYDDNGAYLLASRNLADLTIDSDAGDGNPFINIGAKVSGLDIKIGKIGVQASAALNNSATSIRRGGTGKVNDILSGLSIKTGPMSANIQLGAAPQGAMIQLSAKMVGGLTIENLGILDNSTTGATVATGVTTSGPGEIFIGSIKVTDANSKDLTLNQSISVFGASGLPAENANKNGFIRIVSTSGAHDTYVQGIQLGSRTAASIGDMEVQGMQTYYSPSQGTYHPGAIITIAGH